MLIIGYYLLIVSTIRCCIAEEINYRITGGIDVKIEKYPFVVIIEILPIGFCGGSVISNRWILTAAHCLKDSSPFDIFIKTESDRNIRGKIREVKSIHSHPKFDPVKFDYDCGLLKLKKTMVFNKKLQPVKLPYISKTPPVNALSVVLGFGENKQKLESSTLKRIIIPILSQRTCKQCYSSFKITERMFCAGYLRAEKDSCQGDSGGPLIFMNMNIQLGIVSFGDHCGKRGKPGVYTSVGNYEIRNFIKTLTGI